MKKFLYILTAVLLIAAICAACTPGVLVDTLNGLGGATPGNAARMATSGSAAFFATPANAATSGNAATPGNAE